MPETALSLVTDACPKYTPAFFFFFGEILLIL